MTAPRVNIEFFDTTPRDGAQSLPDENQFPEGAKPEICDAIAGLGVTTIEAGFPIVEQDGAEVWNVAHTVGNTEYEVARWVNDQQVGSDSRPPVIAGLSRVSEEDIVATWDSVGEAERPRIHTFVSTDDYHREKKFPGVTRAELVEQARKAVRFARTISTENPLATVEFSAEAATTTDMDYLERVVKSVVDEGADVVNVPDTVGQRDPFWMYGFYDTVIGWVMETNPEVTVSAHNHNDLANAVPNTMALLRAAADRAQSEQREVNVQFETTICGLGERAGNADIFSVAANIMKFSPEMAAPVHWQINPSRAIRTARTVMDYAGLDVDRQNPVVGSDTNTHRSGIHSDGVIKGGSKMYTPHDPRFWGHDSDAVHEDGRYQGRAGRTASTQVR